MVQFSLRQIFIYLKNAYENEVSDCEFRQLLNIRNPNKTC